MKVCVNNLFDKFFQKTGSRVERGLVVPAYERVKSVDSYVTKGKVQELAWALQADYVKAKGSPAKTVYIYGFVDLNNFGFFFLNDLSL